MDNRVDPMLGDQRGHKLRIAGVTDDKQGALGYRPIEPGGKVVEHHDTLAGIEERVNHVASDISSAASEQDRHLDPRCYFEIVAAHDNRFECPMEIPRNEKGGSLRQQRQHRLPTSFIL